MDRYLLNRREWLNWPIYGLGGAALLSLESSERKLLANPVLGDAADLPPHHLSKAKRAIHIYLCGGLSQVDSFDYKPELIRLHGKSLVANERPDVFFGQIGLLRRPDWEFHQRGQSGKWISD